MKNSNNTGLGLSTINTAQRALVGATLLGLTALSASAQTSDGSTAITTQIGTLPAIAVAVVGAAVLVVIVPWAAKIAIKAFKAICG